MEKDVMQDRQAAVEMVRISGQQGVPVITIDGQVVVGFDQARLRSLLAKMSPKLGAMVADAASQAKKVPGIPESGAYVGDVHAGSAADKGGLKRGDVITALAGQPVRTASDLHRILHELRGSAELAVRLVRDGLEREIRLRL